LQRIEFRDVAVRYGETLALRSVSLDVEPGEFVALLGPSGCGKTTLLRVISGFVPYEGSVLFDRQPVDAIPAHRRDIGIVFQDYALFPHKTVRENIAFGLRMRKASPPKIAARVDEMVALLRLDGLGGRYPGQLSGGQQQRVALARAIAIDPRVLLLDEPLGALDKMLREEMQVELRQLQKRLGITTIFVTHDQEEALSLADRIAVMNHGRIEQIGRSTEIYERPRSRFVVEFMGHANLLEGKTEGQGRCAVPGLGSIPVPGIESYAVGEKVLLALRSERLSVAASDGPGFDGVVEHVTYLGQFSRLLVRTSAGDLLKVTTNPGQSTRTPSIGSRARFSFDTSDLVVLAEDA
jgi:putative spermidine/putrescine transport system ATP-binding protein